MCADLESNCFIFQIDGRFEGPKVEINFNVSWHTVQNWLGFLFFNIIIFKSILTGEDEEDEEEEDDDDDDDSIVISKGIKVDKNQIFLKLIPDF